MIQNQELDYGKYDLLRVHKIFFLAIGFIFMLLILIASSYAALTDNLIAYYSMDSSCLDDSASLNYDLTGIGTPASVAGGILNNACSYEKTESDGSVSTTFQPTILKTNNTWCLWTKDDTIGNNIHLYTYNAAGDTVLINYNAQTASTTEVYTSGTGGDNRINSPIDSNSTWKFSCAVLNNFGHIIAYWIDGQNQGSDVSTGITTANIATFAIGCLYRSPTGCIPNYYNDGLIDEVGVWNRTLTTAEIAQLYNNGAGLNPLTSAGGTQPSLTLSTSIINNSQNGFLKWSDGIYRFGVNGTSVNNSNIYSGSLYVDGYVNQSFSNKNLSQNLIINLSFVGQQTPHNLTINFYNENASSNVSYNAYFDGVYPEISSTLANNTRLFRLLDPGSINVTFADNNLYAVNFTLYELRSYTNLTRMFIANNSMVSSLAVTSYQYNYSRNLSQFNLTSYEMRLTAWDSHTAKELGSRALKDGSKVKYKEISFYCDDQKTLDFEQLQDRVILKPKFNKKADLQYCYFEGSNFAKVKNSQYPNHYVDLNLGIWVDDYDGAITQESPGRLKITYSGMANKDGVITRSIGDLNIKDVSYYFNVSDSFTLYFKDLITGSSVSSFNISLFSGSTLIEQKSTTTGALYLNLTGGSYNLSYSSLNYVDNVTAFTATAGGNLTLYATSSESLYLIFYDEQTDQILNSTTINLEVINFENSSFSYTTTNGIKFISGFASGSYEINYRADGFNPRTYYTTISGGSTQSLRLYLLNSTAASYTIFTIEDDTGNLLENATISATRFYTGCNCYRVVEMDRSNFNGETTLSLEHYTSRYNFLVNYAGSLVYSSSAGYRITGSSYTLKATLITDTTISFFGKNGFFTNLTFNNNTGLVTLVASDTTNLLEQFCLIVDQPENNYKGYTNLYNYCLNASAGIIQFNVTPYSMGSEIIARSQIHTRTNYSSYYSDIITIIQNHTAKWSLGTNGLFMGVILILTIGFITLVIGGMQFGIIGFNIGLIIAKSLGLIELSLGIVVGIFAVSLVVVFLVGEDG